MTTEPRPVVILGATGFLGRALQVEFGRWEHTRVIAHSSRTLDLTRPEALAVLDECVGPRTTVVIAAALTPDRGQTVGTLMTNVTMLANLARYLESRPVGACAYLGSDAVYEFGAAPVTEATAAAPSGYYAVAKYTGEKIMETVAAARNFPLLSVRLTGLYGPGDPHGSYGPNLFARTLAAARTVRLFGDGEEERDHLYVEDAARVVAALVQRGATGVFNVATGESRGFDDIVATLKRLVPYDFVIEHAPRKGAITHRHFDISHLRRAVPALSFLPFEEGLRATLAGFGAL